MVLFHFFASSWRCSPTNILFLSLFCFLFFHFILELFYNEYLLLFVFYSYYSSFYFILFSSFLVWRYSLVNTSKNKMKKRIILFLFLLKGVHQQASSFSSFLHYNEYLLFTFFSPSYSSYFLFFHFFFWRCHNPRLSFFYFLHFIFWG